MVGDDNHFHWQTVTLCGTWHINSLIITGYGRNEIGETRKHGLNEERSTLMDLVPK